MESFDGPSSNAHAKEHSGHSSEKTLDELRNLLTGPQQQQLAQLQQRLDDPLLRGEELSRILPDAITLGTSRNDKIARAIQPTIEESIRTSVKKNTRAFADAIFPVLGPGIRKAIASTIMGMIQSLNQMLNYSFSFKGLQWRWKAFRSRRPFAEVVLLHSLVYRVEQLFLIHLETGLVLQHVTSSQITFQDPDMISGMLTAIQDFVRDSFETDKDTALDTLRYGGDQSIWIEQGPNMVLAAVIRGIPPLTLRNQYRELLDGIHLKFHSVLESFEGDVSPFEILKHQLEDGLKFQVKEAKTRISPLLWILLIIFLTLSVAWAFQSYHYHIRWENFRARLNAERGIVLTSVERKNGKHYISGLRDPSARDPLNLMKEARLDPSKFVFEWQFNYALDPESTLARAKTMLNPPPEVILKFLNGTLTAEGRSEHRWIADFRNRVLNVTGVNAYDDTHLLDTDLEKLTMARKLLERVTPFFPPGKSRIPEGMNEDLYEGLKVIRTIQHLQDLINIPVHIMIFGHADASGSKKFNLQLSHERAEYVLRFLMHNGVDPSHIKAIGMGVKASGKEGATQVDSILNRTVTFKTFL